MRRSQLLHENLHRRVIDSTHEPELVARLAAGRLAASTVEPRLHVLATVEALLTHVRTEINPLSEELTTLQG